MRQQSQTIKWIRGGVLSVLGGLIVWSCSTGESPVAQDDIPGIVFAARSVESMGDPLDPIRFEPGGDLMTLVPATPSGTLRNLTGDLTNGAGDVSDPEIFLQTSEEEQFRVVFSMRTSSADRWHLYEVEVNADGTRVSDPVQLTCGSSNEVDPQYLPDGRIVFSSDRPGHLDEYERRRSTVLHMLDRTQPVLSSQPACDSGEVVQISFNQSHDRNPIVLRDGMIAFSRWEHLGRVNKFPMFVMEPDGTDMFVKYGSHSGVNSFLDLRELADGQMIGTMMPLTGTFEGGALGIVDVAQEADDPNTSSLQLTGSQVIPTGEEASEVGRYHGAYPVPDGTNRYVVSYSTGKVVEDMEDEDTGVVTEGEEPRYGIWMLNNADGTLKPIKVPDPGTQRVYVEPVPLMAVASSTDIPTAKPTKVANRQSSGTTGVLAAASVYDSEANRALSNGVLGVTIPRDSNGNIDFAALVGNASLQVVKQVRVIQAVPSQPGVGVEDMGLTDFERQKILGYAPVEADGSFRVTVPADTSLTLHVVDNEGRSFKVKENWLQVRPGENRTCNGCHSPRRGQPQRAATDSIALLRAPSMLTAPDIPVIDYTDHVQTIFDAECVSCHSSTTPSGNLDLSGDLSGLGFPISYTTLLGGEMESDGSDLVQPGESRQSHLVERIFGEELRSSVPLPAPDANNHAGMLSDQDKRTIVEWIDLGAQFSNYDVITNPGRANLDATVFETTIQPILQQRCASCHVAGGDSNFVLTGDPEGDFGATAARVNVTNPANSLLFVKGTGVVPMIQDGQPVNPAPLATTDADYTTILNWITAAQ
jgi:mono/diheme cytochrome c family protein